MSDCDHNWQPAGEITWMAYPKAWVDVVCLKCSCYDRVVLTSVNAS